LGRGYNLIINIDEMKEYLRLDGITDDDLLLLALLETAEEYVKNATGFKFDLEVPEIAKLIVRLLVSHWYDNRGIVSSQNQNKIDFTVNTLLQQLTYSYTEEQIDGTTTV
jgi:uncharacterized phage protein (predicted DNA packaging)